MIPSSLNDREHRKFRDLDNEVVVATVEQETTPTDPSKTNPTYTITRTYVSPTLTVVIQKTIDSVTYTKTIVKNTTTGVETISAWS